jgi:predicted phosphoadenosine phosphosulfate sulfurtransferase
VATTRKKQYLEEDVYSKTLERIRYLYGIMDRVVVSFSGGKDSTAVLNCTLEVARELGRLPVEVVFFDEEAIHPPTIEYVERVANNPEVDLKWYSLEFKHRNACSNEEPYWYCWDKERIDKWVRPMHPLAITEHPAFKKGMSFQEFAPWMYPMDGSSIAMLTGIRTQESMVRYRVIATKKNDSYIPAKPENNQYRCAPIYDWSSDDVWLAVAKFGWDYNRTYDVFNQTRLFENYLGQRVCPPYGEEPLRGLWIYAECFPEMWGKMLERVPGVATAWRYGNSELYVSAKAKPGHLSYKEYTMVILDSYPPLWRNKVKKVINDWIHQHGNKTDDPIPDVTPHPISGVTWRFLADMAIRGNFKNRMGSRALNGAALERKKQGITLEQAKKLYGKRR